MYRLNEIVLLTIVLIVLLSSLTSGKFLDEQKPCKYEDSECIKKLIDYYLNEQSQGDSSVNLVSIDPLKVSEISIKQGANSPVNIDLKFRNSEILGIKSGKTTNVKGFGKDLTQKHEIHIKFKSISVVSDYSITGKVLILPIRGSGKSNMTMANLDLSLYFSGTPFEKDGATYMKIENLKLKFEPERLYYKFENLFNGDKALSDNMNLFLNENWKDIFNEVNGSISDTFAKIYQSVIATVFTKYPYEKYFTA